jgi:hypothetical protein
MSYHQTQYGVCYLNLVNTSETNPVFLCQPLRRRQDIYVAGKEVFNVNIEINFRFNHNYMNNMQINHKLF